MTQIAETIDSPDSFAAAGYASVATVSARARAPRVLFVDHTASLGGGEIALYNLVRHLDPKRHHPVVALFGEGPLAEKLRSAGIETYILPLDDSVLQTRKDTVGVGTFARLGVVRASLRQALRLKRFIRDQRIALVHTNSLKADLIGGVAARLARVPLVWHIRDRITADYLPKAVVIGMRLLARVMPTLVVGNSNATLQTLQLPKRKQTATVYSGLDLSAQAQSGRPARQASPLIGLVGRITWWKGQDIFIRAAAEVLKKFPAARFQIIGAALFSETEYDNQIRELVRTLGISDAVEFTGFRNDVPKLIEQLDLLVHASTTGEPFGQVIVEGMAAGKAVVATGGGGVLEIVVDGKTGIIVPMGDHASMADAICRLLSDPATATRMGLAGRARVEEFFTVQRSAATMHCIYESLLGSTDLRS